MTDYQKRVGLKEPPMIGFASRQERSIVLGDQHLYWTIIRNPGFLSPLIMPFSRQTSSVYLRPKAFCKL